MKSTFIITILIAVTGIVIFNFLSKSGGNGDMSDWKQQIENEPGVVIDVRTDDEYNQGHLAVADHQFDLMNGDFENNLDDLDKNKTYYLYCRTGNRSGKAADMMKKQGFEKVHNIGGFEDLANSGFDTE
ncbi:MAG: rhodanese-like domain-containing protein [Balneolaceae bacterium]